MLQSIFAPYTSTSTSEKVLRVVATSQEPSVTTTKEGVRAYGSYGYISQNLNAPEIYSSVTILKNIHENMSADLRKILLSSKYEPFMEVNKEDIEILGYYLKKVNDNINEIVILRQQKDLFSAIYIRGDIDVNLLDNYLRVIKVSLDQRMRTGQTFAQ